MKRIVLLLVVCILISTIHYFDVETVSADSGISYYVANDGDDSNDGLSTDSPWKTIGKVNLELNGGVIDIGDDIYFNRGDTFTDSSLVPRTGGDSSNPMIFGAYGSGNKPIISGVTNAIYYSFHIDYVIFENLQIQGTSGNGIVFEGSDTSYITFRDMVSYETWTLKYIDHYVVEDCIFDGGALAIQGTTSDRIRNGIIRDCIFKNSPGDGLTIHRTGDGYTALVGPNHWVDNCIGYNCGENAFDITSGSNIYITNCVGYDCNGGTILVAHGAEDVVIENYYGYGDGGGIVFVWCKNVIIRNSVISEFTDRALYPGSDNGDSYLTENLFVYNNDIIWYNGDNDFIQGDEDISNMYFKNNIFLSLNSASPGSFVDIGNAKSQTYEGINSNWVNNIWWRGDGGAGDDTWWEDSSGTYDWDEWQAKSVTSGEIRDDPELEDAFNGDFELSSSSPAIDAGDWLTQCNGGDTGTTITVDDANYFFGGFTNIGAYPHENVSGDNIFIGDDTNLVITAIDYTNNQITVNRSITWSDNDYVSLSNYNGNKIDIGAYESEGQSETINNYGDTFFTYIGENTTLSVIGALITGFDEDSEYVGVWNRTSWSSTDALWVKYYGDTSGTDGNVETFDIIYVHMNDSVGTQSIAYAFTTSYDLDVARNVSITKNGINKGQNYTGYTIGDISTLWDAVNNTNITTGEMLAWWNNTGQKWEGWVKGFSENYPSIWNKNVNRYDVYLSVVSATRYFQIG